MTGHGDMPIPRRSRPRLPGGFHLPPFGVHQFLALLIVCVALWTLGALWLGMEAATQWVSGWRKDIHIHVYLPAEKSARGKELEQALTKIPDVIAVREISPDEAAAWMREWLGDVGLTQQQLASRLPLTFELTLAERQSEFLFADIRDAAERFGGRVNTEEMKLARAHRWLAKLEYAAWLVTMLMAMAMAIIIANTLRMTLLSRADEIHLMRLLGAREWFVRMPFILEGLLLGGGAGVLAWLLLWPILWATADWLSLLQVSLNVWIYLPMLVCAGALIGAVGAAIATARIAAADVPHWSA